MIFILMSYLMWLMCVRVSSCVAVGRFLLPGIVIVGYVNTVLSLVRPRVILTD